MITKFDDAIAQLGQARNSSGGRKRFRPPVGAPKLAALEDRTAILSMQRLVLRAECVKFAKVGNMSVLLHAVQYLNPRSLLARRPAPA